MNRAFDAWSFHQRIILWHNIKVAGRNHRGEVILWVNTTTREEFHCNYVGING